MADTDKARENSPTAAWKHLRDLKQNGENPSQVNTKFHFVCSSQKCYAPKNNGCSKAGKNKNVFHNTCAEKQTAPQDQQIYKPASISMVTPISRL